MKLVLMRHGQTEYNERHLYTGTTDVPLNETGVEQARAAGQAPGVGSVYVSPLVRARQTASICFPHARQIVEPGLKEIDFGDYHGRNYAELSDDPAFNRWHESRWEIAAPGGESRAHHQRTVMAAVRRIVHKGLLEGQPCVVAVCHGGVIMACMDAFAQVEQPRDYFSWNPGNCGLFSADVEGDGETLRLTNVCHHDSVAFIDDYYDAAHAPTVVSRMLV